MVFNYTKCKKCNHENNNAKVILNNILPAGICDKICQKNIHCKKCEWLLEKENDFIENHLPKNHKYTNVELQMLIIDKYFPYRISIVDTDKIVKYHIDQVFDKDEVKKSF